MSRRRSLPTNARVALGVTAVLVGGIALLAVLAYLHLSSRLATDLDATLLREVETFEAALGTRATGDSRTLREAARTYLEGRGASDGRVQPVLLVRLTEGRVLSNSRLPLENASGNESAVGASGSRGFARVRLDGDAYRVASAPVVSPSGEHLAVFQAALPLAPLAEETARLAWTLGIAGALVAAAGALLSAFVARASLAPLRRMADTAEEIGRSSLTERVRFDGPSDEVGRLADAFDAMLDRLETAFAEQRRFVADASHELRTPLAVLRGTLEVMSSADLDGADREQSGRVLTEEIARMTRLVDDLLALARLEAAVERHALQPLEVSTMVAEAAGRARTLGPRRLTTDCPEAWVLGHPDLLHRALMNLLRNAVAHTAEDGAIEVACALTEPVAGAAGTVAISITDDGPGIPEDELPRIFDRFYRASERRGVEGSGLGLAIVQRTVELHGGVVTAVNAPGGGARVTVTLPLTESPELATPAGVLEGRRSGA